MQLDPFRSLDVGHKRVLVQQENQGGSLPQLVLNGPLVNNLCSLL